MATKTSSGVRSTVPIAMTIAGIVRKTLSAGAMFASVLDVVSNSPSDPAETLPDSPALPWRPRALVTASLIAVNHLSIRDGHDH